MEGDLNPEININISFIKNYAFVEQKEDKYRHTKPIELLEKIYIHTSLFSKIMYNVYTFLGIDYL